MFVTINIAFPSKKFLGHDLSLPLLKRFMVIDDTILIQVYATTLVGVLIFLTVQRLFEYKEDFEVESSRLRQQKENAIEESRAYQDKLRRLVVERKRNVQEDPSYHNLIDVTTDFETEKERLEGMIRSKSVVISTSTVKLDSLSKQYRDRRDQDLSIKTDEEMLTVAMVMLMVASIIVLLVGSIIELHPLPSGLPPSARIISSILFSIGIILLVGRVYVHGKRMD